MAASRISVVQLTGLLFFAVSGGPYGFEEVIGASGGRLALLGLLLSLVLWSTPLAFVTGELACMMPESGGHIVWIYRAFGPFYSYLNSVLTFLYCIFDGALYPALLVDYASTLLHGSSGPEMGLGASVSMKLVLITVATAMNLGGASLVGDSAIFFGLAVLMPFIALAAVSIPTLNFSWLEFPGPQNVDWTRMISVLLWNVSGFDSAGACANEVENPSRSYPIALLASILLMLVTYGVPSIVGLSWAPYYSMWSNGSFVLVALHAGGRPLEILLALGGTASAMGLFVARLYMNSRLIRSIFMLHKGPSMFQASLESSGTPWAALLLLSSCTAILSAIKFTFLAEAAMVLYAASNMLKFAALVQLRVSEPDAHRPFKIPLNSIALCGSLAPAMLLSTVMITAASPLSHLIGILCFLVALAGYVSADLASIMSRVLRELLRVYQHVIVVVSEGMQLLWPPWLIRRENKAPQASEETAPVLEKTSDSAGNVPCPCDSSPTERGRRVLGEKDQNVIDQSQQQLLPKKVQRSDPFEGGDKEDYS